MFPSSGKNCTISLSTSATSPREVDDGDDNDDCAHFQPL